MLEGAREMGTVEKKPQSDSVHSPFQHWLSGPISLLCHIVTSHRSTLPNCSSYFLGLCQHAIGFWLRAGGATSCFGTLSRGLRAERGPNSCCHDAGSPCNPGCSFHHTSFPGVNSSSCCPVQISAWGRVPLTPPSPATDQE